MTESKIDIQVPQIEKELRQLAKQSGQVKRIRACLFTLVIYARATHRAHYMEEIVQMILEKFPCRVIFVRTDQNPDTDHLYVKVSQVISGVAAGTGRVMIACDRIDIDVSSSELKRVPSVIIPHLVPDLPIYLLWGQIPYQDTELFPILQKYATRVIFDSECATDIGAFCSDMMKHVNDKSLEVMDINWALLSNWRDLLTQLVGTEEKISFLSNCKSLIISYNTTQKYTMTHPEIRGLYLQGWLASCLGWKFQDIVTFENSLVISYVSEGHPVIVALTPHQETSAPPGAILAVEITTEDGKSVSMVRKADLPQVLVHESTPDTCELPMILPLPNVHRGLTFVKEIFFNALGDHYKEMLVSLSQLGLK